MFQERRIDLFVMSYNCTIDKILEEFNYITPHPPYFGIEKISSVGDYIFLSIIQAFINNTGLYQ